MTNHESNNPTPSSVPANGSVGSRTSRRRATILGTSVGMLGGGLVGLAMTVPTFTSAATEDPTDTSGAPVVSEIDDDSADTTTTSERPDPGVRLREALQELVDAGTITADQADVVAEHLAAQVPERHGHPGGHRRGPGMDGEVVAELLGIDADELRSALRDGQSIADLAAANGVDVQTVVDALVAEAQGYLDLAVENGRLTEEEAAEKAADLEERITARVNGERPARG